VVLGFQKNDLGGGEKSLKLERFLRNGLILDG